mgnify:CR=1 FL=1
MLREIGCIINKLMKIMMILAEGYLLRDLEKFLVHGSIFALKKEEKLLGGYYYLLFIYLLFIYLFIIIYYLLLFITYLLINKIT